MTELIIFILATIGMTKIVVDSSLFASFRDYFAPPVKDGEEPIVLNPVRKWVGDMITCHQCAGFWCGMFCGVFVYYHVGTLFLLACIGSFVSLLAQVVLEYIFSKIEV